jgi:hypothetical protein
VSWRTAIFHRRSSIAQRTTFTARPTIPKIDSYRPEPRCGGQSQFGELLKSQTLTSAAFENPGQVLADAAVNRMELATSPKVTIETAVCRIFAGDRLDCDGPAKGSKYVSSVDRQAGACHVRRLLIGEIGDQAGDLMWLANSPERNQGFHHLQVIDCHMRLG